MSSFIIITIISAIGVRHLSLLKEAESFLSSLDDTKHVFDWHKVLDSVSPSIPLFAGSIVLSYVGVKKNITEMVAAITKRIKQKQIQVGILCYKRSFQATVGTKGWVIEKLMRNNALCFYDDSLDHLYSSFQVGARTFLVRSGGLSHAEIAKTSVDFSTELIHVPSLIHYLRGKEPGAKRTSLIHRLLYSNAPLLARGFYVTLSGPCGNELQNSSGETINVLDSDDGVNYIVYQNDGEILFHRSYNSRKDFQDKAKELIKYSF